MQSSNTSTATRSCLDPETRISFLVARWRPTKACTAVAAATYAAAATAADAAGMSQYMINN